MFFAAYMGGGGHVTTVEKDERRYLSALENIEATGLQARIDVVLGDAQDVLRETESGVFDMIFLDGAKGHYIHMLDDCIRAVKSGGLILADNVTFRGMVTGDVPAVRRKITIIKRLKAFLEALQTRGDILSTVLPVGDGLSISVKK
jgi:predicted O-methyltransferase YrrM